MKTLDLTQQGGFPVEQEDLAFMQSSTEEAAVAVAKLVDDYGASSTIILSGFELSIVSTTLTIGPGYVLNSGKIYYYAGQSIANSAGTDIPEFSFSTNVIPGFDKQFENGITHETRYTDVATIVFNSTQADSELLIDRIRRHFTFGHQVLAEKMWKHKMSDFTQLQVSAAIQSPQLNDSNYTPIQYHINENGFYKFRGTFSVPNTFNPAGSLFDLPNTNAKPYPGTKNQLLFGCCLNANLGLVVNNDGEVRIFGGGGSLASFPSTIIFSLDDSAYFKPF